MVNHWFGGKEGLFAEAVLKLPFDPAELVTGCSTATVDTSASAIVGTFLTTWDTTGGGAVHRADPQHRQPRAGRPRAARLPRQAHLRPGRCARSAPTSREFRRARSSASQLVGMGMVRYVARFEPLASADIDTMVAAVARPSSATSPADVQPLTHCHAPLTSGTLCWRAVADEREGEA